MTIAEMARQLNTSRNTLYRRLKENGVDVKQLRDSEGQLTQYGMSAIAALFDGVTDETQHDTELHGTVNSSDTQNTGKFDTQSVMDVSNMSLRIVQLETQCEMLKRENDMLRDFLEATTQTYKAAQSDARQRLEQAANENARLMAALETAQQMQQRLLPENTEKQGRGFFAWLKGRNNRG